MSRLSVTFFTDGHVQSAKNLLKTSYTEHIDFIDEERLFIDNFDLLFDNSAVILGDTRYRNIMFNGIGISSAWVGRSRPLTLGELYFHWNYNELVADECCGTVYIFFAGGSPLSGTNRYLGYCRNCKQVRSGSRPTFREILHPFLTHLPDFPYEATDYTLAQLVANLKHNEER